MPFSNKDSSDIYLYGTKRVCEELEIEAFKADEIFSTNIIYDDIVTSIIESEIIIADITGKNPNVYYELGIAHHLKQDKTIIITGEEQDNSAFDVKHFRIIKYINTASGIENYKEMLRKTLQTIINKSELYKKEFETIFTCYNYSSGIHLLLSILLLSYITEDFSVDQQIIFEGTINMNIEYINGNSINLEDDQKIYGTKSGDLSHNLTTFVDFGFVEIIYKKARLTQKGQYFVDYLKSKGIIMLAINLEPLYENYSSPIVFKRWREKQYESRGISSQVITYKRKDIIV